MDSKAKEAAIGLILADRKKRLSSQIYTIFWDIQEWASKRWAEDGWSEINPDHLKLISIISTNDSLGNTELAKRAGVTKQATSQMVSLLEKRGVLIVQPNLIDNRAKIISLSDYGYQFLSYFGSSTDDLLKDYNAIIGDEKMKTLIEILAELAEGIIKNKSTYEFP